MVPNIKLSEKTIAKCKELAVGECRVLNIGNVNSGDYAIREVMRLADGFYFHIYYFDDGYGNGWYYFAELLAEFNIADAIQIRELDLIEKQIKLGGLEVIDLWELSKENNQIWDLGFIEEFMTVARVNVDCFCKINAGDAFAVGLGYPSVRRHNGQKLVKVIKKLHALVRRDGKLYAVDENVRVYQLGVR